MRRYRALVAYDGTTFHGFQRQRDGKPTIQGELERAIARLVRAPVTVTGAGRTDAGVHALGQVVSFAIEWQHGPDALRDALNANLPEEIAILQLETVATAFHPRFDARKRTYAYHIHQALVRNPLYRRRCWHVRRHLDLDRMNEAAACLVGSQDFATFGRAPQGDNTVRELFLAEWQRQRQLLIFTVQANAFLTRMVRSLVGSLKAVGDGTWSVDDFQVALAARNRSCSAPPAPAWGLYLVSVTYGE